jgi:hypothetical protein
MQRLLPESVAQTIPSSSSTGVATTLAYSSPSAASVPESQPSGTPQSPAPVANITAVSDANTVVPPGTDRRLNQESLNIRAWETDYASQLGGFHCPGDGTAVGIYTEQYQYDAVGNFLQFIHQGANPANPGWTRSYKYNEVSLPEPGKMSNRPSSSAVSGNLPWNEPYTYDLHGNMTSMPQLQAMQWNFKDELLMTQRQAVNAADQDGRLHQAEHTYYVYDAVGKEHARLRNHPL